MLKAYKYRVYPNEIQRAQIEQHIGCCRLVWNLALAVKKQAYESTRTSLNRHQLQDQLIDLKGVYEWMYDVNSQSMLCVLFDLDGAYKSFFRKGGFPRFKRKTIAGSFRCPQGVKVLENRIVLPKIGSLEASISRRFNGKIKTSTVSKTTTNKYFVSVTVEDMKPMPTPTKLLVAVGIDLGIKDFATLSTGEKIGNPKYLYSELKRLKILQRRASRKKKGSKNQGKAYFKVAILHERIANQRKDFLHKVSSKLIGDNQTDTICLETLAVKNMVKNHNLAQAISDVSWTEFVRQLEYKGKWYGKNIIKIDKWFASSKTCSHCGHKYDELNLSERTWVCSNCNSSHDRDINAAINIRNSGMVSPGEPVELLPKGRAMKQESKVKKNEK